MTYSEERADRIRKVFTGVEGVTERKMFGGLSFMFRGNMCCGIANDDLVVRIGPDGYEDALEQPHARLMDFTGRPLKGMVYVAPAGYETDEALAEWTGRGLEFARSLPAK
jgi:TfoX/Sxy family transcriptional regulator of competence genes